MWRTLLSLMLIGTTLAGSSFCCCTLGSLASSATSGSGSRTHRSCCCADSESGPCDSPGRGSKHECPCKKAQQSIISVHQGEEVILPAISNLCIELLPAFEIAPTVATLSVSDRMQAIGDKSSAFPRLNGQAILIAKQAYRC